MNAREVYESWMKRLPSGDPMREELEGIAGDPAGIEDRFYQEIAFGTAGLRGIWGAGPNRMNPRTVGRATKGIADYILKSGESPADGVVFAYDCRYHSRELAFLAASILVENGIRVFIYPEMRSTPELSFAVRRLGALAGINLTASHNPREYNGYKVYWRGGAQVSGEISDGMLGEIMKYDLLDDASCLPAIVRRGDDPEKAIAGDPLVTILGAEMDNAYLDFVASKALRPDGDLDLTVPAVYTPFNGAGRRPMERAIAARGFQNVRMVPEQLEPDPEFATVGYPNPEDPKSFRLAEELGNAISADVLIATDPDSDRMAIEIPDGDGHYVFLNGNQTAALIIDYLAGNLTRLNLMPENPVMVKSIVTGDMGAAICRKYGIRVEEALTGFKNICGRMAQLEQEGCHWFFAYEESIGCAPWPEVRDKDGIAAAMLILEMTAYYRKRGLTLRDVLDGLYREYGCYAEEQVSLVIPGASGAARIRRIMDAFRKKRPETFTAPDTTFRVAKTIDYIDGYESIPASNVLKFLMEDGSWFAMRPSGTEPKIKFYYYAVSADPAESAAKTKALRAAVDAMIEAAE